LKITLQQAAGNALAIAVQIQLITDFVVPALMNASVARPWSPNHTFGSFLFRTREMIEIQQNERNHSVSDSDVLLFYRQANPIYVGQCQDDPNSEKSFL